MTKLLRPRLVAIVELVVALWLAATSSYLFLQPGVPQSVQLAGQQATVDGNHRPPSPPSPSPSPRPKPEPKPEPPRPKPGPGVPPPPPA